MNKRFRSTPLHAFARKCGEILAFQTDRKKNRCLLLAFLAIAGGPLRCRAEDAHTASPYYAYQATYEMVGPKANGTMKIASNGKGKARCDTTAGEETSTIISDLNAKSWTTLLHSQKRFLVDTFAPGSQTSTNLSHFELLGHNSIAGRDCTGTRATSEGETIELWMDNEHRMIMVQSTITDATGKTTTTLKSLVEKAAPDSEFAVPPDYKPEDKSPSSTVNSKHTSK